MNTGRQALSILFLGLTLAATAIALLPMLTEAADLPPRPTPQPPEEPAPPPTGGLIVLELEVTPSLLEQVDSWQALWTVVQWQDGLGHWHDVMGWRGNFDEVEGITALKRWWVAEDNFGTGPFRWLVLSEMDGEVLASTEPFDLPTKSDRVTVVTASSLELVSMVD